MRLSFTACVAAVMLCTGCGYIGPVVPPSPEIPIPVSTLSVVERGGSLIVSFTSPNLTRDALSIKHFSDIDLRMGPDPVPFSYDRWAESARRYQVPLPPEVSDERPTPPVIERKIPVSEWQGKTISVAVRTAVKGEDHFSAWSNRVTLEVVAPLSAPEISVDATREGYRLHWPETRPGLHYQVLRQGPLDQVPLPIGTAEKSEYVDGTAQWDTSYRYSVIAQEGAAVESLPSRPVSANHPDTFAPAAPLDVNALAGPDSIEVSWTRSPEADLKGYLVYRVAGSGPFTAVSGMLSLPTFSDRKVEHGHTYRYVVSSIDQKNNESDRSAPVEVAY